MYSIHGKSIQCPGSEPVPPHWTSKIASQCPVPMETFTKPRLDQQMCLFVTERDSILYNWKLVFTGLCWMTRNGGLFLAGTEMFVFADANQ